MAQSYNPDVVRRPGTVAGLFSDRAQAEEAVRQLQAAGFADRKIGVLIQGTKKRYRLDAGTKATQGTATGAVSGGVLGGIVGLFAWIGAVVIPGIGPIVAVGGVTSTLAGAGLGAAAGGLIGGLVGLGIPEEDARYYEAGIRDGGIPVTVKAGSEEALAQQILLEAGATLGPGGRASRGSVTA